MKKNFYHKIGVAELLAAVIRLPESERGQWILDVALDLEADNPRKAKTAFAKEVITKTRKGRKKAASSGKLGGDKRWGGASNEFGKNRSERLSHARSLGTHTADEWNALVYITDYKCVICGCEIVDNAPTKDHILPISRGGSDAIENIQPACRGCNSKKTAESTDYRPKNWRVDLDKRMTDGLKMHSECMASSRSSSRSSISKPKVKSFVEPTLEQITAYCRERQNSVDPQRWLDHYTSNGFKVGKNKMKDWKAAVRTWEKNGVDRQTQTKSNTRKSIEALDGENYGMDEAFNNEASQIIDVTEPRLLPTG